MKVVEGVQGLGTAFSRAEENEIPIPLVRSQRGSEDCLPARVHLPLDSGYRNENNRTNSKIATTPMPTARAIFRQERGLSPAALPV